MRRAKYRRALEAALAEYDRLKTQREVVETRLAQLRHTIASLAALCGVTGEDRPAQLAMGFTDACRSVLRASPGAITATVVQERLQVSGFDVTRYSNPLASIHTILKRLVASGEVRRVSSPAGKALYWWKRPVMPLAVTGRDQAAELMEKFWGWPAPEVKPKKRR